MAAPRGRGRPAKVNSQAEQLSKALNFVASATEGNDPQNFKAYVRLEGNMAIASTGQITAGHPIAEELKLCPHLERLKLSLLKCGKTLVLTETPTGQLSVKGDKLRAVVPCVPAHDMPVFLPDQPVAVVDDRLKEAFKGCGILASEAGERVVEASLLLEANTCTGTNGYAMLQFWHGIDLPPHMVLPKAFTAAIAKAEGTLTGFGFSWDNTLNKPGSITLWFEGGSWLKTQCYSDRWPDVARILDIQSFPADVPAGLFDAVEAVEKFSDDKVPSVFFAENKVMSHPSPEIGAQWEVPGLPAGKRFNSKMFRQAGPFVNSIDLTTYADKAVFFGGSDTAPVRGVIMGMTGGVVAAEPPQGTGAENYAHGGGDSGWSAPEGGSHMTGDPSDDMEDGSAEDGFNANPGWG